METDKTWWLWPAIIVTIAALLVSKANIIAGILLVIGVAGVVIGNRKNWDWMLVAGGLLAIGSFAYATMIAPSLFN